MTRRTRSKRPKFSTARTVFRGRFCTVEHRVARYPSGRTKLFEHVRRMPTVSVFAFDRRGRILLIREYRENLDRWRFGVPGGRVDKEQSARAAAQRELREETGYRARRLRIFSRRPPQGYLRWPWYVYVADDLVRDPLPQDEGEDIRLVPTSLRRAYRMALDATIESEAVALALIRLWHQRRRWLRR